MNIWPENTEKVITIIAKETDTINVYSRLKNTADEYVEVTGTLTYRGEDTWELLTSFVKGEYLLKIVISNDTAVTPIYVDLSVVTIEQFDLTVNQNLIKEQLATIDDKIVTENSWKVVG